MKQEFSAGGVVIKRENGQIYILVCQHSGHHGWVFPKGHIGDKLQGESKEEAALREVKEETGIDAAIGEALDPVAYWFDKAGEKIKKTVYYYLMEYRDGDFDKRDMEMEAVEWLPLDEVEERLTYDSDRIVFDQALQKMEEIAV